MPEVKRRGGERERGPNHQRPCSHGRKSGFQTHHRRKSEDAPSRGMVRFQCYLEPSDYSVDKNGSRKPIDGQLHSEFY